MAGYNCSEIYRRMRKEFGKRKFSIMAKTISEQMCRAFLFISQALLIKKDPGIISNTGILIHRLNSLIYEFVLLSIYFRNVADEVNYFVAVAPFVVIPAYKFYEVIVESDTCFCVKD